MLASRYAKFDAFVKRVLAFCEWMQGSGWEMTNNNQSVQPPMGDDFDIHQMRTLAERIVSRFLQDAGLNNPKVTMLLVDNATRALLKEPILESWGLPDITGISLLDLPNATLGREDREMLMGSWCAATYSDEDEKGATLPGIKWKRTLTIMVALMKKPALHKNMKYRDLALMSKAIKLLHTSGTDDDRRHLPDIIQLFRELCTLTFRHMPKNGQVASTFFNRSPAITDMVAEDAFHEYPHMVILGALSETHGDEGESSILGVMIKNCLERFVREWPSLEAQGNLGDDDWRLLPILTAVDSSRYVAQHLRDQSLSPAVISQLIAASKSLMTAGLDLGWKLWKMLRQIYVEAGEFPLDLGFFARPRSRAVGLLKDCLDVELEGKGEADKLLYIRGIRDAVTDRLDVVGGIFATRHILESLSSEAEASDFSIPECHMWLCERLPDTSSSEELALLTDTIYHLLDQKAKAMTQWNIDRTISSIRVACSARAGHTTHTVLLTSPRGFEYLCRLVELLLKRHRRRIEGRFNVLSDCLTALLRHVMLHPPQVHLPPTPPADDGASKQGHQQDAAVVNDQVWLRQASALARVVQLTCEPTTASVTRYTAIGRPDTGDGDDETGQHQPPPQLLNSAVARAKHLAGQHMHVVLMTYIRVLLTGSGGPLMLPTAIRDCVEQQALWPVWGVLSTDAMKRLEDGLDHGGRTVMKELYRQWTRFGKWTGV